MGATNAIDVSSYQGTNFNASVLKNTYGINKISMKFTQGTYYLNPYAKAQYDMTVNAGSIPCPYHYTVANGYAQAYEEAQFFIKYLRAYNVPTNTPVMLDLEDPTYIVASTSNINSTSNGWHDALANAGYNNQILYMSASWFINYYDSNTNKIKKTWGAQYLYSQQNYFNEPNLESHNWYSVWQFASTWGNKFPNGYWGGSGLDVNHDYNNAISYSNTGSQNTTSDKKEEPKEEGEEIKMYTTFPADSYGVLTFFEDATVNGRKFEKGSGWQVPKFDAKKGSYTIGVNLNVVADDKTKFYFQPSPYNPENPQSAKGAVVQTKDANPVYLYTEPTDDLSSHHAQSNGKDWTITNSMAYRVGKVLEAKGTVWLELAKNAYIRINDVNFKL